MNPLEAFWHKTRQAWVPLTLEDFRARSGRRYTIGTLTHLIEQGHIVKGSTTTARVYEITQAGIAASGVKK